MPATILVWVTSPATAQQAQGTADREVHAVQTYFYKDPRPERLIGFITKFEGTPPSQQWGAYPPIAGLLAVVFRSHPTWIGKLVPAQLNSKNADAVTAALQLSGQLEKAGPLLARIRGAGSDERLKSEFSGLPKQLEDIRISIPTHLDILWGASFASGDGRFARMIADFSARTANRSEPIAIDVAQTTLALMGGPRDILTQLRGRHGDAGAREIIYAATALWALQSNAHQHPFVDEAFAKYIQEHSGTLAAKAFSAARLKKQK